MVIGILARAYRGCHEARNYTLPLVYVQKPKIAYFELLVKLTNGRFGSSIVIAIGLYFRSLPVHLC